jgi:hypothetical protein
MWKIVRKQCLRFFYIFLVNHFVLYFGMKQSNTCQIILEPLKYHKNSFSEGLGNI